MGRGLEERSHCIWSFNRRRLSVEGWVGKQSAEIQAFCECVCDAPAPDSLPWTGRGVLCHLCEKKRASHGVFFSPLNYGHSIRVCRFNFVCMTIGLRRVALVEPIQNFTTSLRALSAKTNFDRESKDSPRWRRMAWKQMRGIKKKRGKSDEDSSNILNTEPAAVVEAETMWATCGCYLSGWIVFTPKHTVLCSVKEDTGCMRKKTAKWNRR